MTELYAQSLVELKRLLDKGAISSVDIVRSLHARADETEPDVRGFSRQLRAESLQEAERCDRERRRGVAGGPLGGLPFSLKENIALAGYACTTGLRREVDHRPAVDASIVIAARRAGAFCIGKSNVPQGLLSMRCENNIYGPTYNPWSLRHVSGGSSSGEGALIASGASLFGFGTDLGGSIRFPAAFCGICGFKPTQDAWSNIGINSAVPGQNLIRAQVGPMARSAADLALIFDAIDTQWMASRDWRVPDRVEIAAPSKRRIGYFTSDGVTESHPAMRRAVQQAVDALRAEGHELVEVEPWYHADFVALYLAAMSADGLRTVKRRFAGESPSSSLRLIWWLATIPRPWRRLSALALRTAKEPTLARIVEETGELTVEQFWQLVARSEQLKLDYQEKWRASGISALVTPAAASPAVPIGMEQDASMIFSYFGPYNILGMPAGVLPISRVRPNETIMDGGNERIGRRLTAIATRSAGLPVAVQVVAPPGSDRIAVQLMCQIEPYAHEAADFPRVPTTIDGACLPTAAASNDNVRMCSPS
ncbi:MAG: amidase [Deltaproteobacteria bacterium]|nr:amidase [Deltaproteobacteria bacterium]